MGNPVVDNEYFDWLCRKVGVYDNDPSCDMVLNILSSTDFDWYIANDDNRATDGIVLRSTFMDDEGWYTPPLPGEPCTMLEMLIGLASRIDNDIMWDGEHDNTEKWFWEMINNLDMDWHDSKDIYTKIDRFIHRKYDVNGVGGLFPLRKGNLLDQREVEIWYQAQSYLMENYEF